jgi:hypothetical protein
MVNNGATVSSNTVTVKPTFAPNYVAKHDSSSSGLSSTDRDILIGILVAFGGVCLLSCIAYFGYKKHKSYQQQEHPHVPAEEVQRITVHEA